MDCDFMDQNEIWIIILMHKCYFYWSDKINFGYGNMFVTWITFQQLAKRNWARESCEDVCTTRWWDIRMQANERGHGSQLWLVHFIVIARQFTVSSICQSTDDKTKPDLANDSFLRSFLSSLALLNLKAKKKKSEGKIPPGRYKLLVAIIK